MNVEPPAAPAEVEAATRSPSELRSEVAMILASGLRRLRDRYALEACPAPEHPAADSIPNTEMEETR